MGILEVNGEVGAEGGTLSSASERRAGASHLSFTNLIFFGLGRKYAVSLSTPSTAVPGVCVYCKQCKHRPRLINFPRLAIAAICSEVSWDLLQLPSATLHTTQCQHPPSSKQSFDNTAIGLLSALTRPIRASSPRISHFFCTSIFVISKTPRIRPP
jgi:hypothetical protein